MRVWDARPSATSVQRYLFHVWKWILIYNSSPIDLHEKNNENLHKKTHEINFEQKTYRNLEGICHTQIGVVADLVAFGNFGNFG